MADTEGENSNCHQAAEEAAGQQYGRPIGGVNEVSCREIKKMAGVTGLEPATSGVTGRRSNQLSYTPAGPQ